MTGELYRELRVREYSKIDDIEETITRYISEPCAPSQVKQRLNNISAELDSLYKIHDTLFSASRCLGDIDPNYKPFRSKLQVMEPSPSPDVEIYRKFRKNKFAEIDVYEETMED